MKLLLISATLAMFAASAAHATKQIAPSSMNIEPCEQLTKDAILSGIPPQVTITLEEYKKSAATLGMVCWLALQDGYEGKARNPQKFGSMSKEGVDLYQRAYDEGLAQSGGDQSESGPTDASLDFYRNNGFNTKNPEEIKYADSLWKHVMGIARAVKVNPTGETCYLIISHDRKGKIIGTRSDGGKSPGGNGPDGDAYCKAVESAVSKSIMPSIPVGIKNDYDELSLSYFFEDAAQ